ncbi:MAG: hypothetical protein ACPGTP_08035 [Bacteroidia bacterium]
MRIIIGFVFVFSCLIGFAQDYVDLVKTEYTSTPQNQFDSSMNSTQLEKMSVDLTAPIQLKNGNAILTGFAYGRVNTSFFDGGSNEPVSSYLLKIGMNIKHSDNWSGTYLLLPKLASDFDGGITDEDFQIGALALAKKKKSENMIYKFGAYMNADKFGPFLVPLFGFYYQKNKLEMDVIVPSYAKINYSVTPKITAGVNWRATVRSYNLNKPRVTNALVTTPFYMHHLSNEVAAHVGYEPIKGVIVRGVAGMSLGRSFRVYENSDKIDFGLSLFRFGDDRAPLNKDFGNGMFYRAELAYRYYLD